MKYTTLLFILSQILPSVNAGERIENNDDVIQNYSKNNSLHALNIQEKENKLQKEIELAKHTKGKLVGQSRATARERDKYESQIKDLELYLSHITNKTSMNDILAEIARIEEKYHPKDNL